MSGPVLGAVLAGGRSSRFGSDKAEAVLGGRTLLDHVVRRLGPQVDALVVTGREHAAPPWLPDRPAPGLGPLGGLCAALRHALDSGYETVVSVGCDMPGLPDDLVAALSGDGAAIVADCPIIGWWPASLASLLEAHLAEGGSRAVGRWADRTGARRVALDAPLVNVNIPADLVTLDPCWTDRSVEG